MKYLLSIVTLLFFGVTYSQNLQYPTSEALEEMLYRVNEFRSKKGKTILKLNAEQNNDCNDWAKVMADHNKVFHNKFNGIKFGEFCTGFYLEPSSFSEVMTFARAIDRFEDSKPHNKGMKQDYYKSVAFGGYIDYAENIVYVTMRMFKD